MNNEEDRIQANGSNEENWILVARMSMETEQRQEVTTVISHSCQTAQM